MQRICWIMLHKHSRSRNEKRTLKSNRTSFVTPVTHSTTLRQCVPGGFHQHELIEHAQSAAVGQRPSPAGTGMDSPGLKGARFGSYFPPPHYPAFVLLLLLSIPFQPLSAKWQDAVLAGRISGVVKRLGNQGRRHGQCKHGHSFRGAKSGGRRQPRARRSCTAKHKSAAGCPQRLVIDGANSLNFFWASVAGR